MKKTLLAFIFLVITSINYAQVTTSPTTFNTSETVTITVDILSSDTDCNTLSNPTKVYMHSGIGDDSNPWGYNVIGNWGTDDGVGEMTNNNNGTWSITITPKTYYGLTDTQAASATKMGMVFRNAAGNQELKATGCSDLFISVGDFQVTLNTPEENSTTILSSGENLNISASNTAGNANYTLTANGSILDSKTDIKTYSFTHTNITSNQNYELTITQNSNTVTKTFAALVNPGTISQAMADGLENGINYHESDATIATLVLDAPLKDFVYVAGSFNNWSPSSAYAMKKDPNSGMFWLELTGLTAQNIETYQYWVVDETPITNTPIMVKTADPFSTLVLSPFDDPEISSETYPNLPDYPTGQEREVTVLQTGMSEYDWQVTNFEKPKKEDLVIYEVLIRDFDADRNIQDLIDRIDYFKNLNVNAIQLMPIMEFEGNESWGYNTSFHMALDKFYGTENKVKEFIDVCHQNGIAVILDVALNHAYGRNPMVRMWMEDPDGDGWGDPSSENPYFNTEATHSYSVGSDFNHQQTRTQYYVERVVEHWITDFNIDGFRWDLTKGFTQNCTASDENCTNSYQQDRVDILKQYADYSWDLDATQYVIFEHLGQDNEEQEWANYKIDEGKGIMMWGKMTDPYNQLTMGYASDSNFERMGSDAHGFTGKRLVGYAESHDEERLMYKNLQYGASSGSYNVKDLTTALQRMETLGAITLTIPGPKMIWHFGDLGMDNSIFTCTDGSVSSDDSCKLSTKPQPQWTENWLGNESRTAVYNTWSRLNELKINEDVFEGDYTITSGDLTPRIRIWNSDLASTELNDVVIVANFDTTIQTVEPDFPSTGTWYDLMDETGKTSISSTDAITLEPGTFKIYGNTMPQSLGLDDTLLGETFTVYPNPSRHSFQINTNTSNVSIFDVTGKRIKQFKGHYTSTDTFDVSELKPGLYIVHILNSEGQQHASKLLKI
ncbi:alpha-amylase family glycosyl hydrolase [Formosa algae]|uniref:1,4-alpha-glucan branching enzyme n=1 Tax=Formosa algae TaxID=225843 RepID=A0A9X0YL51_9FLAO|nr:alpha-amylase family glycosyl hydrolase [Formosa algae]MBP1839264.1 1,4-alpha-glucan branching enzyme [Formosa algae]MDQ0334041.1 1,4-alpha-glucan branching enzyme [Formosa algae]OEI79370.1 alpha-amylase [Formosa algae]